MKTVLITGANNGIGLETTKELLKNDYNVIAISKHINNLEEIKNSNLKFFPVNLTNPNEINDFFDKIIKEKQIDILINNAGRGIFKKSEDFSIEEWNSIISLNLYLYLFQLSIHQMLFQNPKFLFQPIVECLYASKSKNRCLKNLYVIDF